MTIPAALAALTVGEPGRARDIASGGDSPLAGALTAYLASDADGTVYVRPAAFEAFINGGGNVGLYRRSSSPWATPPSVSCGRRDGHRAGPFLLG